jgi:hypothetical protein
MTVGWLFAFWLAAERWLLPNDSEARA